MLRLLCFVASAVLSAVVAADADLVVQSDFFAAHGTSSRSAIVNMAVEPGHYRLPDFAAICLPERNLYLTHKETTCQGADFFLRMTPGLEHRVVMYIVKDESSLAEIVDGKSNNDVEKHSAWSSVTSHGSAKRCGQFSVFDECFINHYFSYTSSWKDLTSTNPPGVLRLRQQNVAEPSNASTSAEPVVTHPPLADRPLVRIVDEVPRHVAFETRLAGSLYNLQVNAQHFLIEIQVPDDLSGRAYLQFEVRLTGKNSSVIGFTGLACTIFLLVFLAAFLMNIKRHALRQTRFMEHYTARDIWTIGGRPGGAVGAAIAPQLQLPEIVGKPVTPGRLQASLQAKSNRTRPTATDSDTRQIPQPPTAASPSSRATDEVPGDCDNERPDATPAVLSSIHGLWSTATSKMRGARIPIPTEGEEMPITGSERAPQTPGTVLVNIPSEDDEDLLCRICQDPSPRNDLFAPCSCSGTSKYVHQQCLSRWRLATTNPEHRDACAECKGQYVTWREQQERQARNKPASCHEATTAAGARIVRALLPLSTLVVALFASGYLVKFGAFILTAGDVGIVLWPDWYHFFLGSALAVSQLLVTANLCSFMSGIELKWARVALWGLGYVLPFAFGYVATFFIWMAEIVVLRPEVSYPSGVVCMVVMAQYFLPSLQEAAQRAELNRWFEITTEAHRQRHEQREHAHEQAEARDVNESVAEHQGPTPSDDTTANSGPEPSETVQMLE